MLFSILQTCSILQTSKTTAVSSTAAATFQQVLSALFDELLKEDRKALEIATSAEAPGLKGPIQIRPVAHDAVRVLADLCLLASSGKPTSIRLSALPEASCLELIEAILANYASLIGTHTELAFVVKTILLPYLLVTFRDKRVFPVAVRVSRLMYMIVRSHHQLLPLQCAEVLECFNYVLDQSDAQAPWKRVVCLEIYRGLFMEPHLVLALHALCGQGPDKKPVIRNCTASFVRLASEKPALIGLSQQSTVPIGNYFQREMGSDASAEAASSSTSAEGTAGVSSSAVPGISNQYSAVRAPFIDQLDKLDAPSMPETYIYSLVLLCLNNLADSLAKFILPLTVQKSSKGARKSKKAAEGDEGEEFKDSETTIKRTPSLKKRNVPVNPLSLRDHVAYNEIKTAAALIDQCWPAILASCSTFFYAALDSDHYRALVRSFQKYAQVAGLLRMFTPRDAFLTTLGKAAVPAHLITSSQNAATGSVQSPSLLRSASGLLNVENLVNQASTLLPDRTRRASLDAAENNTLSSRNLLCLRALLNLAIALGPTLETSWTIIFETLQQADKIMATVNLRPISRDSRSQQGSQTQGESAPAQIQVMVSEAQAISAAVSRLFESTADFPNESFVQLLRALCAFVDPRQVHSPSDSRSPPPTPGLQHKRASSLTTATIKTEGAGKDFVFALSKIRELIQANIDRFVAYPPEDSGWRLVMDTIIAVAIETDNPSTARMLATDLLSHLARDMVSFVVDADPEQREAIHLRALSALSAICIDLDELSENSHGADDTTNEAHFMILEALRAVIEQIGDGLIKGWDIVFDIICTAFAPAYGEGDDTESLSTLKTMSLGRSAFGSTQLICSDFLASVLDESLLTLIETIRRFAKQDLDLNMSLTATGLFWNLSDLLYGRFTSSTFDDFARNVNRDSGEPQSLPALWTVLLEGLRDTAADRREEVRTGAISTLIRIFDNHGDDLSADSWQFVLTSILLPLIKTDAENLHANQDGTDVKGQKTTTKLVLDGVARLVSTYIDTIAVSTGFANSWKGLTRILSKYLSYGLLDVDKAVFDAITTLLAVVQHPKTLGENLLQQVVHLWAQYDPPKGTQGDANQDAYLSYVKALRQIYRLTARSVTTEATQQIIANLYLIVETSGASPYASDSDSVSRVQKDVLDVVTTLRTDIDGSPSIIAELYARFISLPFSDSAGSNNQPTFVALAKSSMDAAVLFTQQHVDREDLLQSALLRLLEALESPIRLNYAWKKQGKKHPLWQKATTTALSIMRIVVPQLDAELLGQARLQQYWDVIVAIGKAIVSANLDEAGPEANIFDNEDFDIEAIATFEEIALPALGSASISDTTRRAYARALFDNSIVHAPEADELPNLDSQPLKDLYYIRFGRTYNPEPTLRESMAYQCFASLLSLVAQADSTAEQVKLAQAAAPYMILRSAITLHLYIADHPLRGRFMPLPKSQREELMFVLTRVRELDSEALAIPKTDGLATVNKRHLVRLYPLVVKAMEVEGRRGRPDEEMLLELRKVLQAVGQEFML